MNNKNYMMRINHPNEEAIWEQIKTLRYMLSMDLKACDAKWSLFVIAVRSPRTESVLVPYPCDPITPQFKKSITQFIPMIDDTPHLVVVQYCMTKNKHRDIHHLLRETLHWLFIEQFPRLHSLDETEIDNLCSDFETKTSLTMTRPKHAFTVEYSPSMEAEYEERFRDRPVDVAYFGGKLDIFFSVIHNVFSFHPLPIKMHLNVDNALRQSTVGKGWEHSMCGHMLKVVAVVDFIKDPALVEYKSLDDTNVVTNVFIYDCEIMRIRQLLFYGGYDEERAATST